MVPSTAAYVRRFVFPMVVLLAALVGVQLSGSAPKTVEAHLGPISGAITVGHGTGGFGLGGPIIFCGAAGSDARNWTWCYVDQGGVPLTRYYYTWNCGPTSQFGTTQCPSGNDYNWVNWQPNLPYSTDYRVCTYIPPAHAYTGGARYKVFHASGVTQITFNQQPFTGWLDLGVYQFNAGTSGRLYLGDYTGEGWATHQIGVSATQFVVHSGPCGSGDLPADGDADEWPDTQDNCPANYNPIQENNDGDSQGDACDSDDDNDSVADPSDNCQFVSNTNQANNDGDAQGDVCDSDDDNDSVADPSDNCQFISNTGQSNYDGDATGDVCDPDDDNDTVVDISDNCQFAANLDQADNDGDMQGDACDPDDDNDTVVDLSDNCQLVANADQANNDADTEGDVCDPDDDNDAITDLSDNCQFAVNPGQENNDRNFIDNSPPYAPSTDDMTRADSDPQGDACDPDDDNDGLSDAIESFGPCATTLFPTDPLVADTDGDRVLDGAECALGTDPASTASKPPTTLPIADDTDRDGLSDAYENSHGSNPDAKDSDGDGLLDGVEVKGYNTSPTAVDSDADGVRDSCEVASLNGDTVVNPGDQALLSAELTRAVPAAQKLANFDLNKDGAINPGDQAFQASKVGAGKCP